MAVKVFVLMLCMAVFSVALAMPSAPQPVEAESKENMQPAETTHLYRHLPLSFGIGEYPSIGYRGSFGLGGGIGIGMGYNPYHYRYGYADDYPHYLPYHY